MAIAFIGLETAAVRALQAGGPDAYGSPAEIAVSDGDGVPCRHCLHPVAKGLRYLTLAFRPFKGLNPYTETGPIFLHANPCVAAEPSSSLPAILDSPEYIVRGYNADERIIYGTGAVTPRDSIRTRAETLFTDPTVAFVDVRSARNNCFQCRIVRA
jgi:Protein of unknown function (DUF1203)